MACTPLGPSSLVKTGQPAISVQPPSPFSLSRPFLPDKAVARPRGSTQNVVGAAALPSIRQTVAAVRLAFLRYSPSRKPIR